MTIALDTFVGISVDYAKTATASITVGSGTGRIVIVEVEGAQSEITSVKVGGIDAAFYAAYDNPGSPSGSPVSAWYLLNPASGPQSVVITYVSATSESSGVVTAWSGVDQTTPFVSNSGTSSPYTGTPSYTPLASALSGGQVALSFIASKPFSGDPFVADGTLIASKSNGGSAAGAVLAAAQYYTANGTTQTKWTWATSSAQKQASHLALVLNPASGGTGITPTLTSPTAIAISSTQASYSVTTNEATGTLYRLFSTNPTETAATIKAANLTQAVTTAGAQTGNTTVALNPNTTYYGHFVYVDGLAAQSAPVDTASFTTPAAPNAAPTFPGTIANITGTGGTAITPVDVHAAFSDTDTLTYSASLAGTAWPSGLVINSSTGIISGTVATSTTTGLKVRATDTAAQTVDSNAFSVTLSAPASTVTSVTVAPATATVNGGATQAFTATVAGTNSPSQTVNWSMAGAGSINASTGVYTAPAATSSAQSATITATSAQDNTKSNTATVTVPAVVSTVTGVTVTPAAPTVTGGATQAFTAAVVGTNSPSQTVTWTTTGGTITTGGVLNAPAATASAQTVTVRATSTQDGTKSGTATVTVPATAAVATSYVDMGTDACDNIQSGLMASVGLTAVVINRSDLTVAKQVITGITTTTGSLVPRFATTFAVGTPVHIVFINAADNTITGIVSDHATVA